MFYIKNLIFALMLIFASNLLAEGGKTGNGGSTVEARKVELATAFVTMKKDLLNLLELPLENFIKTKDVKDLYVSLKDKGLKEEINNSTYSMSENCVGVDGKDHSATAIIGDLGGIICINLNMLAEEAATINDMYGNIIHEHAHHLGFDESDTMYLLVREFSKAIDLYKEDQNRKKLVEEKECNSCACADYSMKAKEPRVWLTENRMRGLICRVYSDVFDVDIANISDATRISSVKNHIAVEDEDGTLKYLDKTSRFMSELKTLIQSIECKTNYPELGTRYVDVPFSGITVKENSNIGSLVNYTHMNQMLRLRD